MAGSSVRGQDDDNLAHLWLPTVSPNKIVFSQEGWILALCVHFYGTWLRFGPETDKKQTWPISNYLDLMLGQFTILLFNKL